ATISVRLACGLLLLLASGCAATPEGYTERDLQARCENTGGRRHPAVAREGFCEYQSPGMI
ncbi:MAG: hypothetical protein Q8P98_05855, partial [Candidatus Rokubacteria bacterium]|nr:hypothetical protein [Candidatus Rokubacteria bacterium]